MTKLTDSKQCIPHAILRVPEHPTRRFQQRGMQSPLDRSLTQMRDTNRIYKGSRQADIISEYDKLARGIYKNTLINNETRLYIFAICSRCSSS